MVSPMDVAWSILKADFNDLKQRRLQQVFGPVHGHLRIARDQAQEEAENAPRGSDPLDDPDRFNRGLHYLFAGMDIKPELMRPSTPSLWNSDASEDREAREMVAGDSPQRRLDIFEQNVGRPPSDEEARLLVAESRGGVPLHQSFSADYAHLDEIFGPD